MGKGKRQEVRYENCPGCGNPANQFEICANAVNCPCGWGYTSPEDNISEEELAARWNKRVLIPGGWARED